MHPPRANRALIHELLQDVPKRHGELVILTGGRGSGKTTWCQALNQEARERGFVPHGLISPGMFQDGIKTDIELVDLAGGRRDILARRREQGQVGEGDKPATQTWLFDPETLYWGEEVLKHILAGEADPVEILIIDEMGPLEFERGAGWVSGLVLIDKRQYHLACVSLRPALLATARRWWSWGLVIEAIPGGEG